VWFCLHFLSHPVQQNNAKTDSTFPQASLLIVVFFAQEKKKKKKRIHVLGIKASNEEQQ
jgi:hypothetical protein